MAFIRGKLEPIAERLVFYGKGAVCDIAPRTPFYAYRERLFARLGEAASEQPEIFKRVNLCNQLSAATAANPECSLRRISRRSSRYFYDLNEYLKYFPAHLRVDYLFGDITHVPGHASLVKSRPISRENVNSVLLNLDKLRHFKLTSDRRAWNDKAGRAVWRGGIHNRLRTALVRRHAGNPAADVGHIGEPFEGIAPKSFMTREEQMAYRYIISVEGNDVATNLKWIMASGSVCLMTRPRFETWFLESRLVPDLHYVELADDFSDLDEKIDALEADPDRALRIVANANAYVRHMADRKLERIVSLLVLQKYFEATAQLPPSTFSPLFFGES
ncbi:glycosyl transferase family 90 [Pseudohoeflea suaedae]|nr:glycosyl transferase family 90 [Pseudohoeflea suaedae]